MKLICIVAIHEYLASIDAEFYNEVEALKVSSDARYVISSNNESDVILWNIAQKRWAKISNSGNPYSLFFAKHSHIFAWQNVNTGQAIIQNVHGKIVEKISHSQLLSWQIISKDLNTYLYWNKKYGIGIGRPPLDHKISYFIESGKIPYQKTGVVLDENESKFITINHNGPSNKPINLKLKDVMYGPNFVRRATTIMVWKLSDVLPFRLIQDRPIQLTATISPNGNTVVMINENHYYALFSGEDFGIRKYLDIFPYSDRAFIVPFDTGMRVLDRKYRITAAKYLDDHHFVILSHPKGAAVLYHDEESDLLRYITLIGFPEVGSKGTLNSYTVDSAPSAKTLVMSTSTGHGIVVYRFNEKHLTMEKVWWSKF